MELDDVQIAAQEQFGKQSRQYGSGHILADVHDVEAAAAKITLPERADILDLATGAGHTGLFFAALGHRVTCADIALPMLDRVNEGAIERGLKVVTRQHSAEELPYEARSFDLVTCRVAAHHFSSPDRFIAESARVLRPGGWLLLIDGSVQDDEPEAEEWLHEVEKLRDPSHHRLLSPFSWRKLCTHYGLAVRHAELTPFKQPDLEWYFETAATPAGNRDKVRQLVLDAPESAKRLFGVGSEDDKVVWWWPRLTMCAEKT